MLSNEIVSIRVKNVQIRFGRYSVEVRAVGIVAQVYVAIPLRLGVLFAIVDEV